MSLFQRKFVIREGSIDDPHRDVEFYEIRSNASSIANTRCIQVREIVRGSGRGVVRVRWGEGERGGSIDDPHRDVEFYEIRSNASSIANTRCIQVNGDREM